MKRLFLLSIVALLLFGCTSGNDDSGVVASDITGTDGLELEFIGNTPPKYYEGDDLLLTLDVRNRGQHSDPEGKLILSGYDFNSFQFSNFDDPLPSDLPGRSSFLKEGGYSSITYEAQDIRVPYGSEYDVTVMASSCYTYTTRASPTICVAPGPEIYSQRNPVCKPKTVVMTSQGAPVVVRKVEEEISQNKLTFAITIENRGDGEIFDQTSSEAFDNCPFGLRHQDKNIIQVSAQISGMQAKCYPEDLNLRLIDGKGVILCEFIVTNTQSAGGQPLVYTTPLDITLTYGYTTHDRKSFSIVRPPGTGN